MLIPHSERQKHDFFLFFFYLLHFSVKKVKGRKHFRVDDLDTLYLFLLSEWLLLWAVVLFFSLSLIVYCGSSKWKNIKKNSVVSYKILFYFLPSHRSFRGVLPHYLLLYVHFFVVKMQRIFSPLFFFIFFLPGCAPPLLWPVREKGERGKGQHGALHGSHIYKR